MSSILKALEKVEESQASRRNGGASGLGKVRERRPAWILPAAVLGGAAVAALGTFAVMGGFSRPAATAPRQAQVVAPAAPVVAAQAYPVTEAPAALQERALPIETPAVFVPNPKASSVKSAALPAGLGPVPPVPVPRPAPLRPSPVQAAPAKITPVQAATPEIGHEIAPDPASEFVPAVAPAVVPDKPRDEIRVTGIAWQNDSKSSVAIVNGRSVQQGGTVNGYKVEKILEDGVRFSGSGGNLTVPLGGGE